MGLTRKVYDLTTTTVLALPSAASTTVNGTMIDLGSVANDVLAEGVEVAESKPAPAAGTEAPAPAPAP